MRHPPESHKPPSKGAVHLQYVEVAAVHLPAGTVAPNTRHSPDSRDIIITVAGCNEIELRFRRGLWADYPASGGFAGMKGVTGVQHEVPVDHEGLRFPRVRGMSTGEIIDVAPLVSYSAAGGGAWEGHAYVLGDCPDERRYAQVFLFTSRRKGTTKDRSKPWGPG